MNDEELQGLLRSLPRERASEGFTGRVMSRLGSAKRPFYLQPRFAVAASLGLVVTAWLGAGRWQDAHQKEQRRQRIEAIRTEVEQLERDIRLLRNLAPVLYLGGDEEVDFVIDLRQLVREEPKENLRPVSLNGTKTKLDKGEVQR
jgi:hypothetical protein